MNFAKDLATYLQTNVASLTIGTNLFYNVEIKDNDVIPDLAVFIYTYIGGRPDRSFGGRCEVRYPRCIIAVRSNVEGSIDGDEIDDAFELSETIYTTLQSADITGYEDSKFSYSNFQKKSKDEQNRHIFVNRIEGFYNVT